jgi:Ser/Thr protein kinase RdoA (MazF antagonist)
VIDFGDLLPRRIADLSVTCAALLHHAEETLRILPAVPPTRRSTR